MPRFNSRYNGCLFFLIAPLFDIEFFEFVLNLFGKPSGNKFRPGVLFFFDLQLVDYVGTGNVSVQCFMSGPKRGRK